jgi:hypothetical protein
MPHVPETLLYTSGTVNVWGTEDEQGLRGIRLEPKDASIVGSAMKPGSMAHFREGVRRSLAPWNLPADAVAAVDEWLGPERPDGD